MKNFLNNFIKMFGGICLLAIIIEYPISIYQGNEFTLPGRTFGFYIIFSLIYATYKVYSVKRATSTA
jgi:hypothetical protein